MNPQKTVFISYRRNASSFIARAVFQHLRGHDFDVFMDVESIDSGVFDTAILSQIGARAHFLVVLTPGTVERCVESGDWLRREIEYAIECERNIVPLLVNNFSFIDAAPYLTGNLSLLSRLNGLSIPHEYFDAAMDRLRTRYLKQPVYGLIAPLPKEDRSSAERKVEELAQQPLSPQQKRSEELFESGHSKWKAGDYVGAVADCSGAIQLNPNFAEAYNRRGTAYYGLHQFKEAIGDYDQAIMLNPHYAIAYSNRGATKGAIGDVTGEIADYTLALQHNPNYEEAYFNRGRAYLDSSQWSEAVTDFTCVLALNSEDFESYTLRASAYLQQGELKSAYADYQVASHLKPTDPEIHKKCGVVATEIGLRVEALQHFDEAEKLDPNDVTINEERGSLRIELEDYDGAVDDFTKVINKLSAKPKSYFLGQLSERVPAGSVPPLPTIPNSLGFGAKLQRIQKRLVHAYLHRSSIYLYTGNLTDALADAETCVKLDPHQYIGFHIRGNVHLRNREFEAALADLTLAIKYCPDDQQERIALYNDRAEAKFSLGAYASALSDYKRAAREVPPRSIVRAGLAITNHALGRDEQAINLWNALIAEDANYGNINWVAKELVWGEELVAEAQRLILKLPT